MSSENEERAIGRRRLLRAIAVGATTIGTGGIATAALAWDRPGHLRRFTRTSGSGGFGAAGAGSATASAPATAAASASATATVLYSGGLAQWVEAGRDQGHATLGIGLTAAICEMAWNQGIDLYGYDDNRFMKGAEYVAKYNLGQDVPFTPFTWNYGAPGVWSGSQTFTATSPNSRGDARPIWETIYNHYAKRRGLSVPNLAAYSAKSRPEGGGGDYGPNSGGFDQLGFGTLTFTR